MTNGTKTLKERLDAWDRGDLVWTIEMGGLGPGYEQALQIAAFEIQRWMLANEERYRKIVELPEIDRPAAWQTWNDDLDRAVFFNEHAPCKNMGLSGAQVGAAKNISNVLMRRGIDAMNDEAVKTRRIMVSKRWPEGKPVVVPGHPEDDAISTTPKVEGSA